MRIEFEGNLIYSSESIKVLMRNKEGKRLDYAALDKDMEMLRDYFNELRVTDVEVPGGVVLKFTVAENPLVVKLNIRGADEKDESEILELMQTRERYPLNLYHLASDRETIAEAYRMIGYHFAHVPEPQITVLAGGGRQIDISIVEGPEVSVERIIIRGNASVPRKDIVEVMQTQANSFFEDIIGGDVFREDVLREDLIAIKQLYRGKGFLDAEVVLDDLRFSDDKEEVVVSILIDEHRCYRVGEVEFEIIRVDPGEPGAPPPACIAYFTEERLRGWLGLQPGSRFSGEKLQEGLEKIRDEYYARSYLDMTIAAPRQRGRQNELVVDLFIEVSEGPKKRLARVEFVGNEFTRDKILRREVRISPGGYVDRTELERAQARIRRTGWFDRVSMDIHDAVGPDGEPLPDWKSVTYELVEGKTGSLNFGVGISTNGGAFGTITFTKRNFDIARPPRSLAELGSRRTFTGAGQEFRILLAPSTTESAFSASFREPRLFGTDFSLELSAYQTFAFRESYRVDRLGYVIGLGYPLYEARDDTLSIRASLRWRQELDDIGNLGAGAVPGAFLFRGEYQANVITGGLTMRLLDDVRDPSFTMSSQVSADLAGTWLGGDLDFVKLSFNNDWMRVLHTDDEGKRHRLFGNLACVYGEALEDTPELPPYERTYAGGQTFRGFQFRGMGPHAFGRPTGGQWYLKGTLEYELPLIKDVVSVVFFTDAGTLGTSVYESDAFLWRCSVGVGLRLVVPLLGDRPLALDYGIPLLYEDFDQRTPISFSLGRSF